MKKLSLLTAVFVVCSLSFTGLTFAQPDLVISRINYSPGDPKQNQEITFWVFVKNIGTTTAGPSKLMFKVGGESNPPVVNVPELSPGREFRYDRKMTLQRATNYRLTATADALNNVTESTKDNNMRVERITVKSGPQPDLVISQINISPGAPYKNEQITFWVFVKNAGKAWSKKSHLRVQVGGETQGKLVQVPALDPGRTWRYEKKHILDKPGKYLVTATADATKTIIESKEGNNVRKKKFRVKPGTKPEPDTYLPDLGTMGSTKIGGKTWQSLSVSSVTLTADDVYVLDTGKVQIQLNYAYREYNGKKVNTPFKNRIYYNNQLVHEEPVNSMAANEIRNEVVVWQIPNPNFNQQAELKIVIDATDSVTESNPNNNQNITTLTFSGI